MGSEMCIRDRNTGKEVSTKVVRVSPSVKKRLEVFQGGDTPNVVIDRMITFFEVTGFNPRYASRNPTALLEKRMEDLIRIVKSQERDIFKPILERTAGLAGGIHESPDYARMMNEMRDLQEKNRQLRQQVADLGQAPAMDVEKERERLRRLVDLVKFQLDPEKFPRVKFSDEVKVPVTTLQLLIKKINEEYVL